MEKQFTTPVSMKVTEQQFTNDLEQPLKEMGYSIKGIFVLETCPILANNYEGELGIISNISKFSNINYERYFIEPYNPKLFLALASLTTESTETKEEVLARFENKIEERELIGYRFKRHEYNRMTYFFAMGVGGYFEEENKVHLNSVCYGVNQLTQLNLLDIFCEPVYKEIETISIEEAEKELKRFGREVKIDKDLK